MPSHEFRSRNRGTRLPPLPHKVGREGKTWTHSEPESSTHDLFSNIIKAGKKIQRGNFSRPCGKEAKTLLIKKKRAST